MILITGGTGFIGKHLIAGLIEKIGKENLLCLSSKPIDLCPFILHHNYTFDKDIFIRNGYENIETIIHAGAFTPKSGSESNDIYASNSNINNTLHLLMAQLPHLKKVIYLSTLDVYDHAEIIAESTAEKPISLYGFSKLYSEKLVEEWGKQNHKEIQILRVGHVYGPGEEAYQKIIPIAIKRIIENKQLELWGTGDELRSFIYIKDVVKAILNAIALKENVGVINIVGGRTISINELVNKIIDISSCKVEVKRIPIDKIARNLSFDNSKLKKYLLSEETTLEVGLKEEYEYLKNLNN